MKFVLRHSSFVIALLLAACASAQPVTNTTYSTNYITVIHTNVTVTVQVTNTVYVTNGAPITIPAPDLIIAKIALDPSNPTPQAGDIVRFAVTLRNQGDLGAGTNIGVGFGVWVNTNTYNPPSAIEWGGVSDLAAGASNTVSSSGGPGWVATVGTHTIYVRIDDLNSIAESVETNNLLTFSLTITNIPASPTNPPAVAGQGLKTEFEINPTSNPSGVAVSSGQVTVEGDAQFGAYGALHFYFNSEHYGVNQGARKVTYVLPAPDSQWHKIIATYDLQFVKVYRDGVLVVNNWLDQQTTGIPIQTAQTVSFNIPFRNLTNTSFSVTNPGPEVVWQGIIGNSSVPQAGASVWAAFLPALAMASYGDYVFVTFGYNEGKQELARFYVGDPQKITPFGMRHGTDTAAAGSTPTDISVVNGTLYVKRANNLVTTFNTTTLQPVGALAGQSISFPAAAARPIALGNQTWNVNGTIIGQAGGYTNGISITNNRFGHWYIEGGRQNRAASCYQTDGAAWISDTATCRLLRYTNGVFEGAVIHWTPHSYVMAVDKTDRTRVFNRFIEYVNGVPTRFYGADSDATFGFGEGFSSVTQTGGVTIATMLHSSGRQIVKLATNGIVLTGSTLSGSSLLYKSGATYQNAITNSGTTYTLIPGQQGGYHLTASGSNTWSSLLTGAQIGGGTYDTNCSYTTQNGCLTVAGSYVIVACQMEFWRPNAFNTGQGNQVLIFNKTTGAFVRQFGLPMVNRNEVENAPTASNVFYIDSELNGDGSIDVWLNDESNRGTVKYKISAP